MVDVTTDTLGRDEVHLGRCCCRETPGQVALVLGRETAGLIGGAVVACRIWADEGRWFPTAGSILLGSAVGGTAAGLLGLWAIDRRG